MQKVDMCHGLSLPPSRVYHRVLLRMHDLYVLHVKQVNVAHMSTASLNRTMLNNINIHFCQDCCRLESSGGWHSWCFFMWSILEPPSQDPGLPIGLPGISPLRKHPYWPCSISQQKQKFSAIYYIAEQLLGWSDSQLHLLWLCCFWHHLLCIFCQNIVNLDA